MGLYNVIRKNSCDVKKILVVFLCLLSSSIFNKIIAQNWLSGYSYRKQITLDGSNHANGSHSDFPVLFELTSDSDLAADANSDGYDIAFTDSDGITQLSHELLTYTSGTGAYRAYIKMDLTNAADKTIYMYYGNSSQTSNPSTTSTWDSNFQAVLHLQESGSGSDDEFVDASSNSKDGTGGGIKGSGSSGATPTQTTGKFGNAQDFDGSDDRIRLDAINDDSWTAVTVQVWINPDDTGDDRVFGKCWGTGTSNQTWLLRQTGGNIGSRTNVNNGGSDDSASADDDGSPTAYNTSTWYLAAYTWDADDDVVRVYLNGTQVHTSTAVTGSDFTLNSEGSETDYATLGNIPGGGRDFNGQLQEARVSDVARSANWLLTQYEIENDPTGFIQTVGSEENCASTNGGTATATDNSINSGGSTTITLSGQDTTPLQWQKSTDNVTFSDVSGETSTALNTGTLTATTYYRNKSGSGSCIVISSTATVTVIPPFLSGYCYRKKITIDNTKVGGTSDLSNFPVLISVTDNDLRTTGNGGQVENSNGYDISFTTSDGQTGLNHEIISYTASSGAYIAFVNVTTVNYNSDTDIYIYYGNSGISGDPSSTSTWNSDYVGVWHLEEDPNGDPSDQMQDATSNNNDGTPSGTMTTADLVTGQIGNGIDLDGTNDFINISDDASLQITDKTVTLSAWVSSEGSNFGGDEGIILKGANNDESYLLGTNNQILRGRFIDSGNNFEGGTIPTSFAYVVVTYDGTNVIGYIDGAQSFSSSFTSTIDAGSGEDVYLGRRADARYNEGIIDELRISEAAHSPGWIETEYNNQSSPSTFYTFASEEYPHEGGTASAASSEIENNTSTTITLSGHDGSATLQWQISTDNSSFSDVSGETTTTLNTGNLTATRYYRVEVTKSGCLAYSSTATVLVKPAFCSGYCYRKKITIDASKVSGSSDHTSFPMLFNTTDLDLRTTGNNGRVTNSNGYDIKFQDYITGAVLDHEIEKYTAGSGEFIAWVKIPTLSASNNTLIYMYYGNSAISADPSTSDTWDSNYKAVWHLNGDFLDATSNNNDGTEGASGATDDLPAVIANGRGFVGTASGNSYISVPNSTSLNTDISSQVTLEAWARYYLPVPQDSPFIIKSPGVNSERYMLGNDGGTNPGKINTRVTTSGGHFRYDDGSVNADWHHYVMIYNADLVSNPRMSVYLDGVLTVTNNADGDISNTTAVLYIGRRTDTRRYRGVLDELRVSNTARSGDWATTEYNNQNSPSTFYSIGSEEYPHDGGTATPEDDEIDNGQSTTITVTDYESGGSIQWQKSTDNNSFSDMSGETSVTVNTVTLTVDTYFRAKITVSGCEAFSSTATITIRPSFITDYSYRKKITIDYSKVSGSSNHSNFPLLVSFTDSDLASSSSKVQDANGYDIIFADASGTQLDHDLELYVSGTGQLIAWVRIPTLQVNANTCIYMYYGKCGYSGGDQTTTDTWNSNYEGVYHMNDDLGATTTIDDRTSNGNNGTANGTMNGVDVITGQIGNAFDFDGTDDYINFGTGPQVTGSNSRTIEMWAFPDAFDQGGLFQGGTTAADFSLRTNNGTNDNWFVEYANANDEFTLINTSSAYHYYALVYDGTDVTFYDNGEVSDITTVALSTASNNLEVGRWDANEFDGKIDAVKFSDAARSQDWLRTEYNNHSSPSTFYSVAAEVSENRWTGGTDTDWGTTTNWSSCVIPASTQDILIPTGLGNYPVLDTDRTVGRIDIESGASLTISSDNLTVTGDIRNEGTFTAGTGTITLSGTIEQTISGSSSSTFNNLVINKSSNVVKINSNTTINGTLTLTAGKVELNTGGLTIGSSGSISGGGSSNYIITRNSQCLTQNDIGVTGRTGNILFPIGISTSSYTPTTLVNTGTDDDFCVYVCNNVFDGGGCESGTQLTSQVVNRTWNITPVTGTGLDVAVTLQWEDADDASDLDLTKAYISHYTGGAWVSSSEQDISGSGPPRTITVSGFSTFSPFGGGGGSGPLPIDLISFNAVPKGDIVELTWKTATELNNESFIIEKSRDAKNFEAFKTVPGAGNSVIPLEYNEIDVNPYKGTSYYRLKQTDFDGTFTYSNIKSVNVQKNTSFKIYPNPNDGREFYLDFGTNLNGLVHIEVFDLLGKVIFSKIHKAKNQYKFSIVPFKEKALRKGMYLIKYNHDGNTKVRKMLVK